MVEDFASLQRVGETAFHGRFKTKNTLTLSTLTILGGLAFGVGAASAAPMAVNDLQTDQSSVTPVRMDRGERMMMKKRMMRK